MKKLVFTLSMFLLFGMSVQAQTKSCSKSKKACAKTCSKAKAAASTDAEAMTETAVAAAYMEADEAAEANENVEKRVCAKSGSVAFYEKSVCAKSGKVSHTEVKYCTDSKKFVNVSPVDEMQKLEGTAKQMSNEVKADGKKKACAKTCKKTYSKKKGA